MQIANILLSLGGDHGNTVPKFAVTAAEISVLRAIHGDESVKDVEPVGDVKRSHRDERARLLNIYGGAKTADHKPIVEGMFPGIAARVFESLHELDLPESFFKAVGHLKANAEQAWPSAPREDGPTIAEWVIAGYDARAYPPTGYASRSTAEEIAAAITATEQKAPPVDEADEADEGVGDDINDGHAEPNVLG
jgi:hypothetical protein